MYFIHIQVQERVELLILYKLFQQYKINTNNITGMKGRPNNENNVESHQDERPKKAQLVRQYWTEHRLTLIAYQMQYIYQKKPISPPQVNKQQGQKKGKGARKKVNLQYEAGFLYVSQQQKQEIKVQELVKNYSNLNELFLNNQEQSMQYVKQLIKIVLQLKHSVIVKEFCQIYNIIIEQLKKVQFKQIQQQQPRHNYINQIRDKIVKYINNNKPIFNYFTQYLKNDEFQTKKLLQVEAYCILAQKFNFNINQYYSDAFSVSYDSHPSKKTKKGS